MASEESVESEESGILWLSLVSVWMSVAPWGTDKTSAAGQNRRRRGRRKGSEEIESNILSQWERRLHSRRRVQKFPSTDKGVLQYKEVSDNEAAADVIEIL